VEICDVPQLSSRQYLVVQVEAEVDPSAPYYDLTVRCAGIKNAVVDDKLSIAAAPDAVQGEALASDNPKLPSLSPLKKGQRICISGRDTPTYVPPSGIQILSELDDSKKARGVVREAVVLSPTQFCVILDEDGTPQPKPGPGRVFPGPNDHFRTQGSDNRVYDAYHLRQDRGLLLRAIASISKKDLEKQLPHGAGPKLEKDEYQKGDEIFLDGFDAYLIPSNAFEVIDPVTRQPHIGNDHSNVYVRSIGVDQKSGVYVADVNSGTVALVRGEKKLILDPRKYKHMKRRVPGRLWSLIIGHSEPHKMAADSKTMIETPWALSVQVPNNEAILIISKDGRRLVKGPQTVLLEYEETLEVLTLSRGRPKNDNNRLETCFLCVKGKHIGDKIVGIETADFVKLNVELSYGVAFVGANDEDCVKWFDYKDYVMLVCENLRSRVRAYFRQHKFSEVQPHLPEVIREIILGVKPEAGGHRPGMKFAEINLQVFEVEVLAIEIPDDAIAEKLEATNLQIVTAQIDTAAEEAKLTAARAKEETDRKKQEIDIQALKRAAALSRLKIRQAKAEERAKLAKDFALAQEKQGQAISLAKEKAAADKQAAADAKLVGDERRKDALAATEQDSRVRAEKNQQLVDFRARLVAVDRDLLRATAEADVSRLAAVQPALIKAIEGLGDRQALAELTRHLPAATGSVTLLQSGFNGLVGLLKDLNVEDLLRAAKKTARALGEELEKKVTEETAAADPIE
jgi:hypothetical protein